MKRGRTPKEAQPNPQSSQNCTKRIEKSLLLTMRAVESKDGFELTKALWEPEEEAAEDELK